MDSQWLLILFTPLDAAIVLTMFLFAVECSPSILSPEFGAFFFEMVTFSKKTVIESSNLELSQSHDGGVKVTKVKPNSKSMSWVLE